MIITPSHAWGDGHRNSHCDDHKHPDVETARPRSVVGYKMYGRKSHCEVSAYLDCCLCLNLVPIIWCFYCLSTSLCGNVVFAMTFDMPKRQRLQSVPVEIANVFAQQRLANSAFAVVFNMFLQMFM